MTVMQIVQQLFGSMGITMEIFFVTLITSLILGLGLALIRMSKNPILSVIAKFYISVMRGTPLMLQLLVVYFGPFFIFGMQITPSYRLKAVLLGFILQRFTDPALQQSRLVSTRRPECWDTAKHRHLPIL